MVVVRNCCGVGLSPIACSMHSLAQCYLAELAVNKKSNGSVMGRKCLKCGHERLPSDVAPEYECPACGAVYAKVEAALRKQSVTSYPAGKTTKDVANEKAIPEAGVQEKKGVAEKPTPKNAKLASCKTCGKEVSRTAKSCPHCGESNPAPSDAVNLFWAVVGSVFVLWLLAHLFSSGDEKSSKQKAAEERECKKSLQCWGEKHLIDASVRCDDVVERYAKYAHQWTNGFVEPKFSHYRWKDEGAGVVTYIGDKVQFQNGFGAWQNHIYECDFSPSISMVLDVRVTAGKL